MRCTRLGKTNLDIDQYQVHRPDPARPDDETAPALNPAPEGM
jgi:aryl-alcohol dehydrogenase-like predicted oxidoreductase